ncbi:MAG: hypothetical protein NTW29_20635 [Bacteroidetes bacterium]|nr:hypothetical protein [Bacteroidota bacterium]
MKKLLILPFVMLAAMSVQAQVVNKTLRKSISFVMPRTADDDMPGTRGAAVVWHPLQKKYYAAMAGNIGYPLGVYDEKGNRLSDDSLNTNEDIRGMWYNPIKKQIQGNSYGEYGWFSYTLNPKGIPISSTIFVEGMNQPGDQSVGSYSIAKQEVMFLKDGQVFFYNMKGEELEGALTLQWGRVKSDGVSSDDPATPEAYNYTTVVYTGIKGAELGVLNILDMQIELYNIADGFMTQKLKLPEEAPVNQSFNFAYANGMYWLFSMESRTWSAFK